MSLGTVYIVSVSPLSTTTAKLVKYLGLDIEVHDTLMDRASSDFGEKFVGTFPSTRNPAFVSKDGKFTLVETFAVIEYCK